ncbi:MAG: ABC transporter permease [Verrucomicrobiota bacterium]
MSRLPFEAFLALRYLRPRRTFVSVITVISIIGVMLGVAVLIIVISVMSGFDQEYRNRILGFNAHLKISQVDSVTGHDEPLIDFAAIRRRVSSNQNVVGVAPFINGQVLVKTQPYEGKGNPKVAAPVLRGIDPQFESGVNVLPKSIVDGEFDVSGSGLLVGRDFAHGLELAVGDRVVIYSPGSLEKMERTRGQTNAELELPEEFVVRGIFDVGYGQYNSSIIVSSLKNAQQLYELGENSVHGLQVMLRDPFQVEAVHQQLTRDLGPNFSILTWPEENPQIFNALAVEKNMMFFLLFFIMIVAGFGIANCQITFVVQKTREIGILKALGANNRQVLWIFLSQSLVVGFLGVGLGLGMALLALNYRNEFLALMNRLTGFELLPAAIYQIYELPASIQLSDISIICGTAFITCILAGLFPAWKASRLQPVEALRYE